ncbi:MAG: GLPGLI family protein [Polaribacter sp.]|jgi:GLPGLI family protein
MRFFLSITVILVSLNFKAQENFTASYNIQFMVDTISIKENFEKRNIKSSSSAIQTMRVNMKNEFLETVKNSKDFSFNLDFNKNKSKFYLPKQIETKKFKRFERFARYKGEYYSFNNNYMHRKNSFGQDFIIIMPKIKWNITSLSKKIGRYKCYKAVTEKRIESSEGVSYHNVIAWFAPEIPFNFGPKGYGGLPGLILKLEEGNISFNLKNISNLKILDFEKPTKEKKISLKDFNLMAKKMYRNRRN